MIRGRPFGLAGAPGGAGNMQNYPGWGAGGRPGMRPPAPRPAAGPNGMAVPMQAPVGLAPGAGAVPMGPAPMAAPAPAPQARPMPAAAPMAAPPGAVPGAMG